MAEDKGGGLGSDERVILALILLALFGGVLQRLSVSFSSSGGIHIFSDRLISFFSTQILPIFKIFSYSISLLAIAATVLVLIKLMQLNSAQNALYNPPPPSGSAPVEEEKNKRWEKILQHVDSENPNDWKFAILEADIILDEMLTTMRYRGETMSDKLKGVEKSDFRTIEIAWEAHKIRNSIAHEGSEYLITQREAKRVIDLYRQVFEEFHFI